MSELEKLAVRSRATSRTLALEIGAMLTADPDRADPDAVFLNSLPLMDWLLDGPDNEGDRCNRRRAVWRYRDDLRTAASAAARALGEPLAWPGPDEFTAGAARYYAMITGR